jgi:hypothetical protein
MLSWLDTFDMEGKLLVQLEGIKKGVHASIGKGVFSGMLCMSYVCSQVCVYGVLCVCLRPTHGGGVRVRVGVCVCVSVYLKMLRPSLREACLTQPFALAFAFVLQIEHFGTGLIPTRATPLLSWILKEQLFHLPRLSHPYAP